MSSDVRRSSDCGGRRNSHVSPRIQAQILVPCYLGLLTVAVLLFTQIDVMYNAFVANQMALGHVDVYRYFSASRNLRSIDTVMPPLYYLVTAAYLKLLQLLHLDPVTTDRVDMFRVLFGARGGIGFFAGAALIKLPNLVALGAGVIAIRKLASRFVEGDEYIMVVLWLGSPILLTASIMQAQNDVIPAACTLAALAVFDRDKPWKTMVFLGLAAAFKNYALLLIPVTAVCLADRDVRTLVRLVLTGIALPLITAAPFTGREFVTRVFFAHDGNSILTGIHLGSFHVSVFPLAYAFILILAWHWNPTGIEIPDMAAVWLLTLSPIFIVSWWRFQWVVWLVPMAVVLATGDRRVWWIWVSVTALLLLNNLVNLSGNMDGAMLTPVFGYGHHGRWSELLMYDSVVPPLLRITVRVACYLGMLALALGAYSRLKLDNLHLWEGSPRVRFPRDSLSLGLVGPACLLIYMIAMVSQHLAAS